MSRKEIVNKLIHWLEAYESLTIKPEFLEPVVEKAEYVVNNIPEKISKAEEDLYTTLVKDLKQQVEIAISWEYSI